MFPLQILPVVPQKRAGDQAEEWKALSGWSYRWSPPRASSEIRSASPRLPWNGLLSTVIYFSKPSICPCERKSEEYEVQSGAKMGQVLAGGNWSKPPSDFLRFAVNAVKQLPVSSAAVVKEKSSISGASQSSRMVLLHGWQVSLS